MIPARRAPVTLIAALLVLAADCRAYEPTLPPVSVSEPSDRDFVIMLSHKMREIDPLELPGKPAEQALAILAGAGYRCGLAPPAIACLGTATGTEGRVVPIRVIVDLDWPAPAWSKEELRVLLPRVKVARVVVKHGHHLYEPQR